MSEAIAIIILIAGVIKLYEWAKSFVKLVKEVPIDQKPQNIKVTEKDRVSFDYIDSKGELSQREIIPLSIEKNEKGVLYIKGRSKLRNGAIRTFRADRMSNIINLITGEIFESAEQFVENTK